MLVEHVTLKPNFRIERRSNRQRISAQCALVNENFELDAFEIEMDPNQLFAG